MILCAIISVLFSYLIGSISTSLIISKVFFNIDLREYGSKNAGGTNAGRVLGKKVGFIVIFLDALKIGVSIGLAYLLMVIFKLDLSSNESSIIVYLSALAGAIGHCYPIYFGFKGGKAVSTLVGFIVFTNPYLFLLMFVIFAVILLTTKYVSVSSMVCSFLLFIFSFIPFFQENMLITDYSIYYSLTLLIFSILLIFKHRGNIVRLIKGQELKARWVLRLYNKKKNSSEK